MLWVGGDPLWDTLCTPKVSILISKVSEVAISAMDRLVMPQDPCDMDTQVEFLSDEENVRNALIGADSEQICEAIMFC